MTESMQSSLDLLYLCFARLGDTMHIIPHLFCIYTGKLAKCSRGYNPCVIFKKSLDIKLIFEFIFCIKPVFYSTS